MALAAALINIPLPRVYLFRGARLSLAAAPSISGRPGISATVYDPELLRLGTAALRETVTQRRVDEIGRE